MVKRSRDCQAQVNSNAQKTVKLRVLYPHTTKQWCTCNSYKISVFWMFYGKTSWFDLLPWFEAFFCEINAKKITGNCCLGTILFQCGERSYLGVEGSCWKHARSVRKFAAALQAGYGQEWGGEVSGKYKVNAVAARKWWARRMKDHTMRCMEGNAQGKAFHKRRMRMFRFHARNFLGSTDKRKILRI